MSKSKFWLLCVAIVIAILGIVIAVVPTFNEKVVNFFSPDKAEIVQKGEDKTTIEDVLQFRKDILDAEYHDSVFLHMPEIPLIAILIKKGTQLSNYEIAKEYLSNRKYYDDVEFGSQIRYIYKQQKEPDVLPCQPLPESIVIGNIEQHLILYTISYFSL